MPRNRRFKIQRGVPVMARGYNNDPFVLGEVWRSVMSTEKLSTAERVCKNLRRGEPNSTFRVIEDRRGDARVVMPPNRFSENA